MPATPSPAQQAASRANGARSRGPVTAAGKARAARNGTRHGLRGGPFALLPGEDAEELDLLRAAVAADWRPRDAYERHWVAELVAAMWRQQRLRGLEFAALDAAEAEQPALRGQPEAPAHLRPLRRPDRQGPGPGPPRPPRAQGAPGGRPRRGQAAPPCTPEPDDVEPRKRNCTNEFRTHARAAGAHAVEPEAPGGAAASGSPHACAPEPPRHRRLAALTRQARRRAA